MIPACAVQAGILNRSSRWSLRAGFRVCSVKNNHTCPTTVQP